MTGSGSPAATRSCHSTRSWPGDHLRHRMLDLQPRVHLHEVEAAVLVGDELDGARALVVHRARRRDGGLAHLAPPRLGHAGRRRFLEHLLVAPLHGAVALEQVDAVPVAVGEHLDLDVARARHVALDQHVVVAEARQRLALARRERVGELARRADDAHPLAAAAGRRLQQHRVADAVRFLAQERRVLPVAVVTRDERHRRLFHQRLGRALAAHRADRRDRRPDEHDARGRARFGERLVLGQEPVAGMDRLGAGLPRGVDDARDVEVAFARGRRADQHRLVGQPRVPRVGVGLREHGDGAHVQPARRLDDAAGDFAAVRDQDLAEHGSLSSRAWDRGPSPQPSPRKRGEGDGTRSADCCASVRHGSPPLPGRARERWSCRATTGCLSPLAGRGLG